MKNFLLAICLFLVITEVFCQDINKDKKIKVRLHKYVGTAAYYDWEDLWTPRLVSAHLAEVIFLEKEELQLLMSKINCSPDVVNFELHGPYSAFAYCGGISSEIHDRVDTTWEKIWYLDSNFIYRERPYCEWHCGEIVYNDHNKEVVGGDQFTVIYGKYLFQFQIDFSNGRIFGLWCSKNGKEFHSVNFVGHDCTNAVSFNRWFNVGFKKHLLNRIKRSFVVAIN